MAAVSPALQAIDSAPAPSGAGLVVSKYDEEVWQRVRDVARDLSYFLVGVGDEGVSSADGYTNFELATQVVKAAFAPGAADARLAPELEMRKNPMRPAPHPHAKPPPKPMCQALAPHRYNRIVAKESFERGRVREQEGLDRDSLAVRLARVVEACERLERERAEEQQRRAASPRRGKRTMRGMASLAMLAGLRKGLGYAIPEPEEAPVLSFTERNVHYQPVKPQKIEEKETVRIMRVTNLLERRERAVNEERRRVVAARQRKNQRRKDQIERVHRERAENTRNKVRVAQRASQRRLKRCDTMHRDLGGLSKFFQAAVDEDLLLFRRHLLVMGNLCEVLDVRDKYGRSPLHFAAYFNALASLAFVMQHVNCVGRDLTHSDYTIFHYAVLGGHLEAVVTMVRSFGARGRDFVRRSLYAVTREGLRAYNIADNMQYNHIRHYLSALERRYPDERPRNVEVAREAEMVVEAEVRLTEEEMYSEVQRTQMERERLAKEQLERDAKEQARKQEVAATLRALSRIDDAQKKRTVIQRKARELLELRRKEIEEQRQNNSRNKRMQREGEAREALLMEEEDHLCFERERVRNQCADTDTITKKDEHKDDQQAQDKRLRELCDESYNRGRLYASQKYGIAVEDLAAQGNTSRPPTVQGQGQEQGHRRSTVCPPPRAAGDTTLYVTVATGISDRCGLRVKDRVHMINGLSITTAAEFYGIIGTLRNEVTLYLSRFDTTDETGFLGEMFREIVVPADRTCLHRYYGLSVTDGQSVTGFGYIPYGHVLVLEATGASHRVGILPGDIISHVNEMPVSDKAEFHAALNEVEDTAHFFIRRGESERVLSVTPIETFRTALPTSPSQRGLDAASAAGSTSPLQSPSHAAASHTPRPPAAAAPGGRRMMHKSRVTTSIGKKGAHSEGAFQEAVGVVGGYTACKGRRVSGCQTASLDSGGAGSSRVVKVLFTSVVGLSRKVSISGLRFFGLGGRAVSHFTLQTEGRTQMMQENRTLTTNLPLALEATFPCPVVLTGMAFRTSGVDIDQDPDVCAVQLSRVVSDPHANDPAQRQPAWSEPQNLSLSLPHKRGEWCPMVRLHAPTAADTMP